MSFWGGVGFSGIQHIEDEESCGCSKCRRMERMRQREAAEHSERIRLENKCMYPDMGRQMGYMDGNMPEYILFAPTFRPGVVRTFAVSTASRLPPEERQIRITDGSDVIEERKQRRVQEILARLNYLASKNGLDYFEFKEAIERDLEEEALYREELKEYEEAMEEFHEAQDNELHDTVAQFGQDFEEFQCRNPVPQPPMVLICPALSDEEDCSVTLPTFITEADGDEGYSEDLSIISDLEADDQSNISDLDVDQSIYEEYHQEEPHDYHGIGYSQKCGGDRLPSRGKEQNWLGDQDRLSSRGGHGQNFGGDRIPSRGKDENWCGDRDRVPSRGGQDENWSGNRDRVPSRGGQDKSFSGDRLPSRGKDENWRSDRDRLQSRWKDENWCGDLDRLSSRGGSEENWCDDRDRLPSHGEQDENWRHDRVPSRGGHDENWHHDRVPSRGRHDESWCGDRDRLPTRGGQDENFCSDLDRIQSCGGYDQNCDDLPNLGQAQNCNSDRDRVPSRGGQGQSFSGDRVPSRGREFLQDRSPEEWLVESDNTNEPEPDTEMGSEMQSGYFSSEDDEDSITMTEDIDDSYSQETLPPPQRPVTPAERPVTANERPITHDERPGTSSQRPRTASARPMTPVQRSETPTSARMRSDALGPLPLRDFQRPTTASRFWMDRPGTAETSAFLANPPRIGDLDEENLKEINAYNARALHVAQIREDFKSVQDTQKNTLSALRPPSS